MEAIDEEFFEINDYSNFTEAEKGKRFLNFLIDIVSFYLLIFMLSFLLGIVQVIAKTDLTSWTENMSNIVDRLITTLLLVLYLSLMETVFKGRTLGKFITKTKAVNEDGSEMDGNETVIRNLCRLIPLDALSFLISYRGWHDSVSKTKVIDLTKRETTEITSTEN